MILDHVWHQLIGNKAKFWVLKAVKDDTIYVQVKISVAKNELIARRQQLIKELNKHLNSRGLEK